MHPIVIYELARTRMELDREAERRRLARSELPLRQQASASRRPPGARWRSAIRWCPWIRASSQPRLAPVAPRRPGRPRSPAGRDAAIPTAATGASLEVPVTGLPGPGGDRGPGTWAPRPAAARPARPV